jgi:phosphoesterase RecJ-like protein
MLGSLSAPLKALGVPVLFLDHHVSSGNTPALHFIDEEYGSTGELVYALLSHLGAGIDREMAVAIYVAILTDTQSFRFKRTSPRSHSIAADLLSKGVSPEEVYRQIYARDSLAKIRLFGQVLESIHSTADDRVAWLVVTKPMRDHYRATVEDTEAFVNQLTLIEGVSIGLLFREEDDGKIKVSLRGNDVPVFSLAKTFGGGGHRFAAGIKMEGPLADAIHRVVDAAVAALPK